MPKKIFFLVFVAPLLLVRISQAQNEKLAYHASILFDEEGKRLGGPTLVVADPVMKEIYVVDRSRIIIYNSHLFPLFTLGAGRRVVAPEGMAIDKDGNLFVSQPPLKNGDPPRISVFNACLRWVRDIPIKDPGAAAQQFVPGRLALDSRDNIYVTSPYYPGVLVLNREGATINFITLGGGERDKGINGIFIDKDDRLYLLSGDAGSVFVYGKDGKFLYRFGELTGTTGGLSRPVGVGVDQSDWDSYIIDYNRQALLAYGPTGKFDYEIGGMGTGHGWFNFPWDITVDWKGRVFVADTFNQRVEVYKPVAQ